MSVVEIGERLTVPSVDPDRQDQLICGTATQDLELANHEAVVQCFTREGLKTFVQRSHTSPTRKWRETI